MEWEIPLAAISAVCAIVFGYIAFARGRRRDDNEDGKTSGTILADLGYIKSGIDDVKAEQREQRKTNTEFVSRLVAVEESAKQAHKRIDRMNNTPG